MGPYSYFNRAMSSRDIKETTNSKNALNLFIKYAVNPKTSFFQIIRHSDMMWVKI